jgi:hypothetical protein
VGGIPPRPPWVHRANRPDYLGHADAKQEIVRVLLRAGLAEVAEEADRTLPDPVELERAAEFGMRYGITRDELISRIGGSP